MEEGDLEKEVGVAEEARVGPQSAAANRLSRKIADAPTTERRMIEKVVDDILDALKSVAL